MPAEKKTLPYFSILMVQSVFFFSCSIHAYPHSLQNIDSVKTAQNKVIYQKSFANFFKTDSIFSFRSQKGYIPSLFSNFERQLTAPFKFTARDWIITGAAVGLTATLVVISRLTEHQHWASDIFVGGLIGYVCGKEVVGHYNNTHKNPDTLLLSKSKINPEFTFIQNGNQVGFSLKW